MSLAHLYNLLLSKSVENKTYTCDKLDYILTSNDKQYTITNQEDESIIHVSHRELLKHDLSKIQNVKIIKQSLKTKMKDSSLCSTILTSILILSIIICLAMCALNGFSTYDNFINAIFSMSKGCGIAGLIITFCAVSTFIIYKKSKTSKDNLFSKITHKHPNYEAAVTQHLNYSKEESQTLTLIDKSTLDENGTGAAFGYKFQTESDTKSIALSSLIGTPFYCLFTMVYNICRAVIMPLYIISVMCINKIRGRKAGFKLIDIPKVFVESIFRAIKAPFYATAMIGGLLGCIFINTLVFKKVVSIIERDWNRNKSIHESIWLTTVKSLFQLECSSNSSTLNSSAFYLNGCWQPQIAVYYKNNQIVSAENIRSRVVCERISNIILNHFKQTNEEMSYDEAVDILKTKYKSKAHFTTSNMLVITKQDLEYLETED